MGAHAFNREMRFASIGRAKHGTDGTSCGLFAERACRNHMRPNALVSGLKLVGNGTATLCPQTRHDGFQNSVNTAFFELRLAGETPYRALLAWGRLLSWRLPCSGRTLGRLW